MPPAKAFDLSLSVTAHLASMAGSRERAIGRAKSDLVGLGDEISWRAWHFGVPWRLTSRSLRSTGYTGSSMSKSAGPFHRFHHEHRFESVDGGSRMTDIVEFEAPTGCWARLAERLVLAS